MNKYPCELIEDLIPLYIEDDLSHVSKEIVEDHLKECKNCSMLLQEYSDDELKVEDLKEDLPKADTFKTWMKRLKVWGIIVSVLILIGFIATGALGYKISEDSRKDLLSIRKIVKTFKAEGLSLKKDRTKSPEDYGLKGVKPAVYSIGENKDMLLIYTFQSYSEKEKILNETDKFDNPYTFEEFIYHAKNSLIVFKPSVMPEAQENLENIGKTADLISNIVFKDLNDGKERIYKGDSENWEGTYTYRYYEHWYQDEAGSHYQSYQECIPVIRYKKTDIDSVGPITFEYEAGTGSGRGEGLTLDKDACVKLGGSSSNGSILREGEDVRFTVKWGDKEETIVLKAQ